MRIKQSRDLINFSGGEMMTSPFFGVEPAFLEMLNLAAILLLTREHAGTTQPKKQKSLSTEKVLRL